VYDWSLKAMLEETERQCAAEATDATQYAAAAASPVEPMYAYLEQMYSSMNQQPLQFVYDPYAVGKGIEPYPSYTTPPLLATVSFRVQLANDPQAHV
jgi:hypothetical protein